MSKPITTTNKCKCKVCVGLKEIRDSDETISHEELIMKLQELLH